MSGIHNIKARKLDFDHKKHEIDGRMFFRTNEEVVGSYYGPLVITPPQEMIGLWTMTRENAFCEEDDIDRMRFLCVESAKKGFFILREYKVVLTPEDTLVPGDSVKTTKCRPCVLSIDNPHIFLISGKRNYNMFAKEPIARK